MTLHLCQRAALAHVAQLARARKASAQATLAEICAMSNLSSEAFALGVVQLKKHARIALHFHPDRPGANGETVATGLFESGLYKSQFETQLSNGSLSAFAGGARDRWEENLYGGAYQRAGTLAAHRPKYGALDLMRHANGPAPRFGSCYLLLAPSVSQRATFTYLDSHQDPRERGTYDEFDDILAALFAEAFTRDFALGEHDLSPRRLLDQLLYALPQPLIDESAGAPSRNLDHYIEAQVHGDVQLGQDVEILVADPSFRGTATGRTLTSLCERYEIACRWHPGFELSAAEVPDDFRGPAMPPLAARVALDGRLDAAAIGAAVTSLRRDPAAWIEFGSEAEVLQRLKLLWHVLVRYGAVAR